MGRVVGSLVVVAARDEDASSAMLASWVSQASFDPPAITIAVKKDRAMGGLLKPGARFVVSIVPEAKARAAPSPPALARVLARAPLVHLLARAHRPPSPPPTPPFTPPAPSLTLKNLPPPKPLPPKQTRQERPILKALTKKFAPGEDRLAALATTTNEATGCPVLVDANAYLECEARARRGSSNRLGSGAFGAGANAECCAQRAPSPSLFPFCPSAPSSAHPSLRPLLSQTPPTRTTLTRAPPNPQAYDDMDAGDHRVVVARVTGAKVQSDGALTAVHHRKVGNHY